MNRLGGHLAGNSWWAPAVEWSMAGTTAHHHGQLGSTLATAQVCPRLRCGALVAMLARDDAAALTDQTLIADGGFVLD